MPSSAKPHNDLPLASVPLLPAGHQASHENGHAGPGPSADAAPGAQPRGEKTASILIVDDDPRSARLLAAHLNSAGYTAAIAHSAADAQAAVADDLPDLILCDVCLPGTDGIELTRLLRSMDGCAGVPIALVTSSNDSRILARGLEAGADDFLAKPVNALELRTRVRSLLRSKLLADTLRAKSNNEPVDSDGHRRVTPPARDGLPLVVIVDDSPQDRRLLEAHLSNCQFQARTAGTAKDGLELVRACQPDLIVLDLLLPDCNGYEFIAALKEDVRTTQVPILVVSAMAEVGDRVKALELGADDFIVKGSERLEFEARTRRLLRLKRSLDQLHSRCDQALKRAVTDSLTGLYTHGFMQETLAQQLQIAERYGSPYAAIFADVDHFKEINDRHGHAAGDRVLRFVAETLRSLVRQADTLVRYGGEEFVALLPHTNGPEAVLLAERMRNAIAGVRIPIGDDETVQLTMSFGVAAFPDDALDGPTLVQRGDAAMYLAKRGGRNRTVACGTPTAAPRSDARVLIVAAEDADLQGLESSLVAEGCQLLHAHDTLAAIEISRDEQPDVIVMDAALQRQEDFATCRRLKRDPKTQWLPVLMVTTKEGRDDKLRGIDSGVDEFISQPIDKIELATRVKGLVRYKRDMDVLEDAETVVFSLAQAVEDRDTMVGNHMERVADIGVRLGQSLGLSERELRALRRAARVHDIGKIAIPDAILYKPGPLTPEEMAVVREHADHGYRLLLPLRTFCESLPAVRFHHERLDGSGYPLGLRGNEVPKLAQILAVVDIFDSLTSQRHYREALAPSEAVKVLREEVRRGLHDPHLVETFVSQVLAIHDGAAPPTCAISDGAGSIPSAAPVVAR
ncbi:MAG: response regulator [Pirellulales bacterium]